MDGKESTSLVTGTESAEETVADEATNTGEKTEATEASKDAGSEETTSESSSKTEDSQADEVAEGAPGEYLDFTMPEGVEVDKAAMEKFTPLAKEMNLTQEQAQQLVDLDITRQQEFAEAQTKTWEDTRTEWRTEAKADKEYGGDKLNENLALGKKAVEAFGSPELNDLLNEGHGDRLAFIKFAANVGREMGDDTIDIGKSPAGEAAPLAQRLYNKSNMNP